ncbi:hypothetical protein HPB51_025570 [Rhipicephalus microplus]|uniref:Nuclear factor related to kappa-B-binding protein second winged helix domain-containing protein n=1 Tax=Rhipicephalus microplus TaxID=6941 RepID=A0A9J6DRI1_RHIMP|nr:hypothetical protein HPB51_025570 [Rhipicephalus microplus]
MDGLFALSTTVGRVVAPAVTPGGRQALVASEMRDAAARLPNGEGTRADICELLKDSQYLAEASDQQEVTDPYTTLDSGGVRRPARGSCTRPAVADAVHDSIDAAGRLAANGFGDHYSSRRAGCRSEVHPNLHRGSVRRTRRAVVNIDETKHTLVVQVCVSVWCGEGKNRVNDPYVNIGGAGCRWGDGGKPETVSGAPFLFWCRSSWSQVFQRHALQPETHTAGASAARTFRLGTTQVHQAGVPAAGINNIGTATGPQNTRAERGHVGAAGGAGGPALFRERRTVENTAACSARPAAGPCPVAIPWLHAGGGQESSRRHPTTHRCSGGVLRHVPRNRALQVPLQGCHARGADKGGRRGEGHREEGAGSSPAEPALEHGPGGPVPTANGGGPPFRGTTIHTVVSGALDRLHYEKDPCVKYDVNRKLWIYLHRCRTEEEFGLLASSAPDLDDGSSSSDSEDEAEEVPVWLPPELAELFQSTSEEKDFEGIED